MLSPQLLIMDERAAYAGRYHGQHYPDLDLRRRAIMALGGFCACCGESHPAMLSVDHVQGDGRSERKKNARRKLYKRIERGDVEPGSYAALCLSCNQSKGRGRECPHQVQARPSSGRM